MVYIDASCYQKIIEYFKDKKTEQCGLLGTNKKLNYITEFSPVDAEVSTGTSVLFNSKKADAIIKKWAKSGVCFCGVIHSHLGECGLLSKDDRLFIKKQLKRYDFMPSLLFPVYTNNKKSIRCFCCSLKNDELLCEEHKLIIKKEDE